MEKIHSGSEKVGKSPQCTKLLPLPYSKLNDIIASKVLETASSPAAYCNAAGQGAIVDVVTDEPICLMLLISSMQMLNKCTSINCSI